MELREISAIHVEYFSGMFDKKIFFWINIELHLISSIQEVCEPKFEKNLQNWFARLLNPNECQSWLQVMSVQ